jgi:hypothetical protein
MDTDVALHLGVFQSIIIYILPQGKRERVIKSKLNPWEATRTEMIVI